jgi:hypothetical protein
MFKYIGLPSFFPLFILRKNCSKHKIKDK